MGIGGGLSNVQGYATDGYISNTQVNLKNIGEFTIATTKTNEDGKFSFKEFQDVINRVNRKVFIVEVKEGGFDITTLESTTNKLFYAIPKDIIIENINIDVFSTLIYYVYKYYLYIYFFIPLAGIMTPEESALKWEKYIDHDYQLRKASHYINGFLFGYTSNPNDVDFYDDEYYYHEEEDFISREDSEKAIMSQKIEIIGDIISKKQGFSKDLVFMYLALAIYDSRQSIDDDNKVIKNITDVNELIKLQIYIYRKIFENNNLEFTPEQTTKATKIATLIHEINNKMSYNENLEFEDVFSDSTRIIKATKTTIDDVSIDTDNVVAVANYINTYKNEVFIGNIFRGDDPNHLQGSFVFDTDQGNFQIVLSEGTFKVKLLPNKTINDFLSIKDKIFQNQSGNFTELKHVSSDNILEDVTVETKFTFNGFKNESPEKDGLYFDDSDGTISEIIASILDFDNIPLVKCSPNFDNVGRQFAHFNGSINSITKPLLRDDTNLSYAFTYSTSSILNIDNWDTSNVINMESMFENAPNFNTNIGNWNTSKVTNMKSMFSGAQNFNRNIGTWNTYNVTNMESMFEAASLFNKDIGAWNTSKVTNMKKMFLYAIKFNQDISYKEITSTIKLWNTSNVLDMENMFQNATDFNCNGGNWKSWKVKTDTNVNNIVFNAIAAIDTFKNENGWNELNDQSNPTPQPFFDVAP